MQYRETLIFDPTKPIPDQIKRIDKQKVQSKQRYKMRYKYEDKCRDDDVINQEMKKNRILNRLSYRKCTEDIGHGFDFINTRKIVKEKVPFFEKLK